MKATITYSVTTEESAQDGDHAEHGWWVGGYEYALQDEDGYHENRIAEARAGDFDLDWRDAIQSAFNLGATHEIEVNGSEVSSRSVDPPCDRAFFEDGESREYTLHIECKTPLRARLIASALKAGKKP